MFEVQWEHKSAAEPNVWAVSETFDSLNEALAYAYAGKESLVYAVTHRIVHHPTGRVVAVFGSSGKHLTFPIATAIAYRALAQAVALASHYYKEHKPC